MGIITVLWEKWVEFRRDFYKITLAAMISPLMYLLIFGFGIQTTSHGEPYLMFLIPGIVAMSTMTGSFGAVAQNMSVQRLYEKALDQVMVSPTPLWQFISGQILGGALRGMYAALVILLLTLPVQNGLIFNGWSFLIMFLNGMVFSTIALVLSFMSKSYADTPRYNAYKRHDPRHLSWRGPGHNRLYCPAGLPGRFFSDRGGLYLPKKDLMTSGFGQRRMFRRTFDSAGSAEGLQCPQTDFVQCRIHRRAGRAFE